jgi:hypothetical protein
MPAEKGCECQNRTASGAAQTATERTLSPHCPRSDSVTPAKTGFIRRDGHAAISRQIDHRPQQRIDPRSLQTVGGGAVQFALVSRSCWRQTKTPPERTPAGYLQCVGKSGLAARAAAGQTLVDRVELGIQGRAEGVDHRDDRQRDTGCDQTVFDRSCPRLVPPKLLKQKTQVSLHEK